MEKKEFKKTFGEIAQKNGFEFAFGGWFKQSNECIITLELQKSNFSDSYYLNIKIFVQGSFGQHYNKSANLLKDMGDFFRRQPKEYEDALNFDVAMDDKTRIQKFESLFANFLIPFGNKALTRDGIKELISQGEIALLPAVKKELGI
jgi:hypothetical protein